MVLGPRLGGKWRLMFRRTFEVWGFFFGLKCVLFDGVLGEHMGHSDGVCVWRGLGV